MLSLARCRNLLGTTAHQLSDADVQALCEQMYALANVAVTQYTLTAEVRRDACDSVRHLATSDELIDVEERAAIAEFDGGLKRDVAERVDFDNFVRAHRRNSR